MESLSSSPVTSFSVRASSQRDTEKLAQTIASVAEGGLVVYLSGDLGAGKTTFVQAFARALGITKTVNSPTFLVVKEYAIPNSQSWLVHADAYQLKGIDDAASTGLLDLLGNHTVIACLEWPERVPELEQIPHLHLTIQSGIREDERNIQVAAHPANDIIRSLIAKIHHEYTLS